MKMPFMTAVLFPRSRVCIPCLAIAVMAIFFARISIAEVPTYDNEPSNEYLKEWLLCGPFPAEEVPESVPDTDHLPGFETDRLKPVGGETNPRIEEGQTVEYEGGSATWTRYTSDVFSVDLDAALTKKDFVFAYAYCEIESPQDRLCVLALGSNDGGRAWLNGERIWDYPEGRGLKPDDDLIAVNLRKGRNTLLLKIEERGNKWGFCARLLPFDSRLFVERFRVFSVVTREDGEALLCFQQPEMVKDNLLREAKVTVFSTENRDRPLATAEWTKDREMPLGVPKDKYAKYVLCVEGTLMDGHQLDVEIPFNAGKRVVHNLFENGGTEYSIVVGEDASESEKWAAEELQHWLKEASGAEFPIGKDDAELADREIAVGFNRHALKLLGAELRPPQSSDESFTYKNVGPSIVIWGGEDRGTMYGVMTFLERELGCRWYTPRVTAVPKKERFSFDYLYHTESPGIRVRNDFYFEAFDPTWAARNKVNGELTFGPPREQVGGVESYWAVHTFYVFMPPSEFFGEHPEYYSEIDGKRVHERGQLCLTNPDVLRIVTERLKKTMREQPEHLIYSVSQNDWHGACQCKNCQAIVQREESEAGPVIWFVNQVAEAIEKEFPDKFVGTLAYSYTRKPCKTLKPRHNVVVRLCSIECCFAHPFHGCPENATFVADLEGWSAVAPHLYIWDYVVNFGHYILPYPNFRVLQPNIQAFRDNHAIGIMEQAAYQSRGGEFAELRAYVISKLLWDPECDVEKVIDDFMSGYYGRSGQHVRRYFDLLHGRITPETHIHLGLTPDDKIFSDEFVRQAEEIFDEAEAVADTEETRQRVEMARLPVRYLKCLRSPLEAKEDGTYARFCAVAEREGITHYAESGEPNRTAFHQKMESVD